ncbi:cell division protein FtsL [Bacillus sp. DNRA2]|uniref:cell division protein FtsL n=1 Tax=Bacillus sp. DNRA2 TaxID=2723053 RepID=UPI00145DB28B|nr:cell division protein FtsL [Bacillus sp. DNRA2]NMD69403.1 cell division protein FtsL [Bacillus sp. DNRA2]
MSNLAKKLQQDIQKREIQQTKTAVERKVLFSPGEKILALLFGACICIGSVQIVSNAAEIYKVNKGIQDVEAQIQEQQKVNGDLTVQVAELSTYERIWSIATKELGLQLNDNVKVVQE